MTGTAQIVAAGALQLPTGRLVAVDPSWLYLTPPPVVAPFTVGAPPGTYPLDLAVLHVVAGVV